MGSSIIDKVVSQVFTEKALHDFYCTYNTCEGWERNIVDQPEAVQNIIKTGADRIAAGPGIGEELPKRLPMMLQNFAMKREIIILLRFVLIRVTLNKAMKF